MTVPAWALKCAALFATVALVIGCGSRDDAVEAALELAEANYPGRLELHDSRLQKDHYDIVLALKGDPITRVRFAMDRDPAACRQGSACDARMRKAYAEGVAAGRWLKAANHAFRACGVPLLAVEGAVPSTHSLLVELDLGETDQQPALDHLRSCVGAFKAAGGEGSHLRFRILRPRTDGPTQMPDLVTFETRAPQERADEPSYRIAAALDRETIPAQELRLFGPYVSKGAVAQRLAAAAQDHLAVHLPGAQVGRYPSVIGTKLDAGRLDLLRTYVLACRKPEHPPCRKDVAVKMTFDLRAGDASAATVLDVPAEGALHLPELPGR